MGKTTNQQSAKPLSRPELERLIGRLICDYVASEGPIIAVDVPKLAEVMSTPVAAATCLERGRVLSVLQGAVRSAIDAHGPLSDAAGGRRRQSVL